MLIQQKRLISKLKSKMSRHLSENLSQQVKQVSAKPQQQQQQQPPAAPQDENCCSNNSSSSCFVINSIPEPNFEYRGYYKFGKVLGKGAFGVVIECFRKCDDKPVALKFIKRKSIQKWTPESVVRNELVKHREHFQLSEFFSNEKIMSTPQSTSDGTGKVTCCLEEDRLIPTEVACLICGLDIPEVVNIIDYLPCGDNVQLDAKDSGCESDMNNNSDTEKGIDLSKTQKYDESIVCIVLERDPKEICFFDYLMVQKFLEESEAKIIMKQLVQANLDLIHSGIFHGDLKSENILINPQTNKIKIIDFGSAQIIDSSLPNNHNLHNGKCQHKSTRPVRTFRGTYLYKPPEYLLHHCFYPRPFTVWSFGVILYDMICGHFPFDTDMDVKVHQTKEIEFTRNDVTDSFKDLVNKCLAFYVADRIVIENILEHPWITSA